MLLLRTLQHRNRLRRDVEALAPLVERLEEYALREAEVMADEARAEWDEAALIDEFGTIEAAQVAAGLVEVPVEGGDDEGADGGGAAA